MTHTTRQLRPFLVREGRRMRKWPVCFTAAVAVTAICLVPASASPRAQTPPALSANVTVFVSHRLGNCQVSTSYGPLLDQMWVR